MNTFTTVQQLLASNVHYNLQLSIIYCFGLVLDVLHVNRLCIAIIYPLDYTWLSWLSIK